MMEKDTDDHPSIVIAPPLLFLICMGGGFLLDYLSPLKIIRWPWWPRIIFSSILIMISAYFALGSIRILLRNKTPFDPSKPTKTIVCQGPFRFSRNPMYLALLLLLDLDVDPVGRDKGDLHAREKGTAEQGDQDDDQGHGRQVP